MLNCEGAAAVGVVGVFVGVESHDEIAVLRLRFLRVVQVVHCVWVKGTVFVKDDTVL